MNCKTLAIALLLLTAAAGSKAQSAKFGLKAGADINKISGQSFKQSFSYGYQVGAFAQINFTDEWGIQPEVMLSQISTDTASSFKDVYQLNGFSPSKLKYLKIPLFVNYNPNKFVSVQLGPQFGVLLDKNKTLADNGKNAFKQGDFSMVGGLQLNIAKLRVYGRYALGLSDLNNTESSEKWRSQSFQVGLGFTF